MIQVSDTNAELVRLANQVALLEEEKGNLQLSLVDFDELKGRNQGRNSVVAVSIVLVLLPVVRAMHCPVILFSKRFIIHSPIFLAAEKFRCLCIYI